MAAVEAKRAAAVEAKDAAAAVKMNYLSKTPIHYYHELAAIRATRTTVSPDEKAVRDVKEARREFRIAARHVFRVADVDGSKSLTFDELERLEPMFAKELLNALDDDATGDVSIDEWLAFATRVYEARGPETGYAMLEHAVRKLFERTVIEMADEIFDMFDADGSGHLDYGEISAMFPDPPSQAKGVGRRRRHETVLSTPASKFLQFVDTDRSGALDRDEWHDFILAGWRMDPNAARAFLQSVRQMAAERFGK